MKKIISLLITLIMIVSGVSIVEAADPISYSWDFDSAQPAWVATLRSTNTAGNTTNWAEIVTIPKWDDASNKALKIGTGASCWTDYGLLDTGHLGTPVASTPVSGTSVLSFNFYVPTDCKGSEIPIATVRLTDGVNASLTDELINILPQSGSFATEARVLVLGGDTSVGYSTLSNITTGTWHRIEIGIDPESGKAGYTLIKNCDNTNSENIVSMSGRQLWDDGKKKITAKTSINRLKLQITHHNNTIYIDDLCLKQEFAPVISDLYPSDDGVVYPLEEASFVCDKPLSNVVSTINDGTSDIDVSDAWVKGNDGRYRLNLESYTSWAGTYTLNIKATDMAGLSDEKSITFSTVETRPDSFTNFAGFYNENGDRLVNIENGTVTARYKFVQKADCSYTYILGLYRVDNNRLEMSDIVAAKYDAAADIPSDLLSLSLTVPDDGNTYIIRSMVWDSITGRNPFDTTSSCGVKVLQ